MTLLQKVLAGIFSSENDLTFFSFSFFLSLSLFSSFFRMTLYGVTTCDADGSCKV